MCEPPVHLREPLFEPCRIPASGLAGCDLCHELGALSLEAREPPCRRTVQGGPRVVQTAELTERVDKTQPVALRFRVACEGLF